MLSRLSFPLAAKINIVMFGLLSLFHAAVILGIVRFQFVPIDFLWGGRVSSNEQFLTLEVVAFVVQLLCLLLTLIRAEVLKLPKMAALARSSMGVLGVVFSINTVGNVLAHTWFEKGFTLVTGVLALLSWRLAMDSKPELSSLPINECGDQQS